MAEPLLRIGGNYLRINAQGGIFGYGYLLGQGSNNGSTGLLEGIVLGYWAFGA